MNANKITEYRRIGNWENFFLASAIYSVGQSLGISFAQDWTPIAAVTGDLFTYMYSDTLPCDSGVTNAFFMPEAAVRGFAVLGYSCRYFTRKEIAADLPAAAAMIRASVDRGIPILAWGMGGVVMRDGTRFDPLPEACLIGGYDGEMLLAHLYPGTERLASVDAHGYTAIAASDGLATTHGIFFTGDSLDAPQDWMADAIRSIPQCLTRPAAGGYVFGKAAFDRWADVLTDDTLWCTPQLCETNLWDKHGSAYCALCTSVGVGRAQGRTLDFLDMAQAAAPVLPVLGRIRPIYPKLRRLVQAIWDQQDGFMPAPERMAQPDFRRALAGIIMEMGMCCTEILHLMDTAKER